MIKVAGMVAAVGTILAGILEIDSAVVILVTPAVLGIAQTRAAAAGLALTCTFTAGVAILEEIIPAVAVEDYLAACTVAATMEVCFTTTVVATKVATHAAAPAS